jgi:hypothetical protein
MILVRVFSHSEIPVHFSCTVTELLGYTLKGTKKRGKGKETRRKENKRPVTPIHSYKNNLFSD